MQNTPLGEHVLPQQASQVSNCTIISTRKPTYWPSDDTKLPDVIDFFVMKKAAIQFSKIEEGYEISLTHPFTFT